MSKQDEERQVLNEFQAWSDSDRECTIEAFMREREDRANTLRVADALGVLNNRLEVLAMRKPDEPTVGDAKSAIATLVEVCNILEGDRPSIDDSSLTEPGRRLYV